MAPPVKKRKVTPAPVAPPRQRAIQTFGRISKVQVIIGKGKSDGKKGELDTIVREVSEGKSALGGSQLRKRKLEGEESAEVGSSAREDGNEKKRPRACTDDANVSESKTFKVSTGNRTLLSKPSQSRNAPRKRQKTKKPVDASSTLDAFLKPSSAATTASKSSSCALQRKLPNLTTTEALPPKLLDLQTLHSAFLTALSLHHAHNGPLTPADLCTLTPSIARIWGRRSVCVDDIQRLIALEGYSGNENEEKIDEKVDGNVRGWLKLTSYGASKICVELVDEERRGIDEEALQTRFTQNLEKAWMSFHITHRTTATTSAEELFLTNLPLHPIRPHPSLSLLTPLTTKVRLALSDLKAGAKQQQQKQQQQSFQPQPRSHILSPKTANSAPTPTAPLQKKPASTTRTSALLSRLLSKEHHASNLPAPPTAAELQRKSALQRLPEIASVLHSLYISKQAHCNSDASTLSSFSQPQTQSRMVSFTMAALVQDLQMSLRNPISKEEAVRAVGLMAEVVPEWVGVREVGRVCGVSVRGGLGVGEVGRRVGEMLGGL